MAGKQSTSKENKQEPSKLKAESEEKVEVKKLLQDERTHKIAGAFFLLIAIMLFVAFTSYLFTWENDGKYFNQWKSLLIPGDEVKVDNLLGTFGVLLCALFINYGFGVASYLICTFFFVVGVNWFFGKKVFSVVRNLRYVLIGLVVLSVAASVMGNGASFSWGGQVGDMIKDKMYQIIGELGTWAILAVTLLAYIIWRFNPVFTLPAKKPSGPAIEPVVPVEEEISSTIELPIEDKPIQEEAPVTSNALKGESGMMNIIPTDAPAAQHDIKIVEKQELPVVEEEPEEEIELPPPPPAPKRVEPVAPVESLELEIKSVPDKPVEEVVKTAATVAASKPYDPILDLRDYKYPTLELLESYGGEKIVQDSNELESNKNQIINTLKNYDITIQKISATVGPTVTLYEIIPAAGVRISRIKNLEDDIALSLAALGIRIIAPIPGKGTIGIEVPNTKKSIVSMKTLLASEKFQNNKFSLPIAIGKKIDNENFIVDLASMPHLLMAGATGQGKSVGLNAILVSLLYKKHPSQLKFVLVDPKKVELSIYKKIEKHFLAKLPGEDDAIITDTKKVINTLNALCIEMDNRYDLLKEAGCRNIREYNEKFVARKLNPEKGHTYLPFIVLVVDEFADLIMTAGKEVEMPIARLAQLARAVGIHLIIATQRPSVNIITGTIKANFPARIGFKVSSKIDSRTILDHGGAEQLIGKGDMLISHNGELVRLQCAFVDTPEVDRIVDFIGDQRGYPQAFLLPEYVDEKDMEGKDFDLSDKDALFEDAARLIVASQIGSTSLLQRRMKLGYNRAGRLMDQLEAAGVVGPSQGSKARDVLIKTDADLQQLLDASI